MKMFVNTGALPYAVTVTLSLRPPPFVVYIVLPLTRVRVQVFGSSCVSMYACLCAVGGVQDDS